MSPNLRELKLASLSLLLKFGFVFFSLAMLWLDIAVFHTQILEISFTEISQELMLFIIAVSFWTLPTSKGHAGFKSLAGGFFACLLMRELDGLFDPISHSAWCVPFLAIATVCVTVALGKANRKQTLADLAAFTQSRAFGAFATGFGVLLFSRVFGMGSFWHLVLGEGYERLAKTTVEEGVELLAYSMWLATTIEYRLSAIATTVLISPKQSRGEGKIQTHSV